MNASLEWIKMTSREVRMSGRKYSLLMFIMIALCLSMLLLPGCKKSMKSEFRAIRLADLMEKGNIRSSPFLDEANYPRLDLLSPLKTFPLDGPGIGENPFNLKKKFDFEGVEIDLLFAPPSSEYAFSVTLPESSILEFTTGIVRDKNFELLQENLKKEDIDGVNFRVLIEAKGVTRTLFQDFMRLPALREKRTETLASHRVELPAQAQEVRLTFITSGRRAAFAFWHNPVIYTREKEGLNVILVSLDTLRADHLGCYGYERNTSPAIDALAEDSALFLNTYSSSTWTLPAHVSLLTSLFNIEHQVYDTQDRLDSSITTLAEILRQNHYLCRAFTGGAYVSYHFGLSQGFDSYEQTFYGWNPKTSAENTYAAVADWIGKNKDKQFFFFVHTYQTHTPYACPEPYATMFLEKPLWPQVDIIGHIGGDMGLFKKLPEQERLNIIGLYDGEIRYTDEKLIGPLIESLKQWNLYDRTMIIVLSDHGEEFYDHLSWEHGKAIYDECLKVPLLIKFPGSKFRGLRVENIIRLVDVMPTVLEAVGLDAESLRLDGRSLFPVIKGKEKGDRIFLADILGFRVEGFGQEVETPSDMPFPQKIAVNSGKGKLILNRDISEEDRAFFNPPPPDLPRLEFYDLARDPLEKANIVSQKAALARRLVEELRKIYRKGHIHKPGRVEIDKTLEEQLRALGYIR